MDISIKRMQGDEFGTLAEIDRICFEGTTSAFSEEDYRTEERMDAFIVRVDGVVAGSIVFTLHQGLTRKKKNSLYVLGTQLLPRYRGLGLGLVLKAWQIAYAKANGFKWMCGHIRESNKASIAMNKRLGIEVSQWHVPEYYSDGEDARKYVYKI